MRAAIAVLLVRTADRLLELAGALYPEPPPRLTHAERAHAERLEDKALAYGWTSLFDYEKALVAALRAERAFYGEVPS